MSLILDDLRASSATSFLALGDSYTIGEGVDPEARWPNQLVALWRTGGRQVAEPLVIARTGWTTDELNAAVDEAEASGVIATPYDCVSLLIGVNNQYRGRDAVAYRSEHAALLERAIGFAGGRPERVVAVSIPDWGVTAFAAADARGPSAISAAIDAFNAIAAANCAGRGVVFIDVTTLSRQHPDWLVADQLHPDARQYLAWATQVDQGFVLPPG